MKRYHVVIDAVDEQDLKSGLTDLNEGLNTCTVHNWKEIK